MLLRQSQNATIDSYKPVTKWHLYMATDQTYESMESAIFLTKMTEKQFQASKLSPTNGRAYPISTVKVQKKSTTLPYDPCPSPHSIQNPT